MKFTVYYDILKERDFKLNWLALIISGLGNSLYFVALMWIIWDITKSTVHSGFFAIVYDIPQIVLGLWIGVVISRYSLKKIIVLTDIIRGITVLLLILFYLLDYLNLYVLYGAILIEGIMLVINRPAQSSILPQIVNKDKLEVANAVTQLTNRIISVAGYGLAGVIISTLGALLSLIYNAISFFISAILINKISIEGKNTIKGSIKESFKEGFLYLKKEHVLIIIFGIGILMNVGGAPITVLGPAFSENILHAGATGYGIVQASWFLGIAFGAVIIGTYFSKKLWITLSIGFFVQGIAQIAFGLSSNIALALLFIFIHGIFMSVANIPLFSFVQRYVPSVYLPHVFSILGTLVMAVNPLAYAAAGFLADSIGIKETYIIGGLLPIIATLLIILPPWLRKVNFNKSNSESINLDTK